MSLVTLAKNLFAHQTTERVLCNHYYKVTSFRRGDVEVHIRTKTKSIMRCDLSSFAAEAEKDRRY